MIHIKSELQIEQMKAAGALSKAALRRAGAMVKRLAHAHPEATAQEARGNAASVARATSGGSVDLF